MIPGSFSQPLANHLWQSTVCAGIAGLLTLALRHNHARTRHWLWLIASVKFLVPFSLLAAAGSRIGSLSAGLTAGRLARPAVTAVVRQISQPFPAFEFSAETASAAVMRQSGLLPTLLIAIWAGGFLAVVFSWWRRWRRIRAAVEGGSPMAIAADVPVLSSPAMLEPGIFGIAHPVLLLPEGIAERLAPAHIAAILAHEMCHVRRRDNLAAALHMAVEALFWFHPLVWWIGARMIEERERACDEEVLRLGNRPEVYAESILKTCQFYLESPLVCMSGISGSDLKNRITRIMNQRLANRLTFGRKLLLGAAGIAAVAGPVLFGLLNVPQSRAQSPTHAPAPAFDVVSIKPNHNRDGRFRLGSDPGRFTADNITVKFLLQFAYGVKDAQILGAPGWTDTEHYDIHAKRDEPSADPQRMLSLPDEEALGRQMLQAMLADRFKLVVHHEVKQMPVYVLMVGKNGSKLHESEAAAPEENIPLGPQPPDGPQARHSIRMNGRGSLSAVAQNLDMFADLLSRLAGRPVLNQTGLKGDYDFTLQWTPDEGRGQMPGGPPGEAAPPSDASGPSIFTAVQEQLGLKLEPQKAPVDTIAIDRVERPSEN